MTSTAAFVLYLIVAAGAVGVYFLLPRAGKSTGVVGAIFGLAALAALIVWFASSVAPGGNDWIFYVLALIAIAASSRVITHPRPVYSAIYFVLVVVAVAALLILQEAEFLAAALVIIYAGAIIVTYLFVIMLAHQGGSPTYDRRAREPFLAVLAGFVLMGAIAGKAGDLSAPVESSPASITAVSDRAPAGVADAGNTMAIGSLVMTKYVVALEIAGVLLLISMVGAIALSRKRVPREGYAPPQKPIGQVGKEVLPF